MIIPIQAQAMYRKITHNGFSYSFNYDVFYNLLSTKIGNVALQAIPMTVTAISQKQPTQTVIILNTPTMITVILL